LSVNITECLDVVVYHFSFSGLNYTNICCGNICCVCCHAVYRVQR